MTTLFMCSECHSTQVETSYAICDACLRMIQLAIAESEVISLITSANEIEQYIMLERILNASE